MYLVTPFSFQLKAEYCLEINLPEYALSHAHIQKTISAFLLRFLQVTISGETSVKDICSINIFRNHKSNNGEVFDN